MPFLGLFFMRPRGSNNGLLGISDLCRHTTHAHSSTNRVTSSLPGFDFSPPEGTLSDQNGLLTIDQIFRLKKDRKVHISSLRTIGNL